MADKAQNEIVEEIAEIAETTTEDTLSGVVDVDALGVKLSIPKRRLNDFRFLRMMRDIERAQKKDENVNPTLLVDMMELLCGSDFDRVCDELVDDEGMLPNDRISEFFNEAFTQVNLKN